eukprot:8916107-Alexandrium_andersonii.AAC.1
MISRIADGPISGMQLAVGFGPSQDSAPHPSGHHDWHLHRFVTSIEFSSQLHSERIERYRP